MTNKEAIEFGKEQLEIFGESRMSEFIRLAIKELGMNKVEAYRELERLKRMDKHIMRCQFTNGWLFTYEECHGSGLIFVTAINARYRDFGEPIPTAEPMTRESCERFCENMISGKVNYCDSIEINTGEKVVACKECKHWTCEHFQRANREGERE